MARTREFDIDATIDQVVELFWCRGFEATSIHDIVSATGVQRGSLYAAFGSKEKLYLTALDRYRERQSQPMIDALRAGRPLRSVLRGVLTGLVDAAVDADGSRGCLIVSAAQERLPVDPEAASRVRDTIAAIEDALHAALTEAQRSGELDPAKDPRALARFFVATIQGLRVTGVIQPDRRALTDTVDAALSVLGPTPPSF